MSVSIAQQMHQLYSQFGHLPGISIELHKNLLAIQVNNTRACATVYLQGAQLTHYRPVNQQPVIWCSPLGDFQPGVPLRGGIPLCWPWFGDILRNPDAVKGQLGQLSDAPAHGFVRSQNWQLSNIEIISKQLTRLTLTLTLAEHENAFWPHACVLHLTILVGAELTVQLQIDNISPRSITFSGALHSYFAVSHINQVHVNGLDGLHYIDALDQWQSHTQQGALMIEREVDRIYQGTDNNITLHDSGWKRTIGIQSKGSRSAVVWNPWQDRARTLSSFDDQAYKEMLCIETANAVDDIISLASGDSHQLEVQISTH